MPAGAAGAARRSEDARGMRALLGRLRRDHRQRQRRARQFPLLRSARVRARLRSAAAVPEVKALLWLACLALWGCETTMEKHKFQPVVSAQRVNLSSPVTIIETRGPLALRLEWQLLPGEYVERYISPIGRVFEANGALVQFTSTLGEKTKSMG